MSQVFTCGECAGSKSAGIAAYEDWEDASANATLMKLIGGWCERRNPLFDDGHRRPRGQAEVGCLCHQLNAEVHFRRRRFEDSRQLHPHSTTHRLALQLWVSSPGHRRAHQRATLPHLSRIIFRPARIAQPVGPGVMPTSHALTHISSSSRRETQGAVEASRERERESLAGVRIRVQRRGMGMRATAQRAGSITSIRGESWKRGRRGC